MREDSALFQFFSFIVLHCFSCPCDYGPIAILNTGLYIQGFKHQS
jgi:hypothetical protein